MKNLVFFGLVLVSLSACSQQPPAAGVMNVSNNTFSNMMSGKDAVILDVRTPEEFQAGHIPNAVLINYQDPAFKDQVAKLDKEKTYLVYCQRGGRSAGASQIMWELGFTHVYNLENGFSQWDGKVE